MANSARIRLDKREALFLKDLFAETRHRLVVRRADAKSREEDLADFQIAIGTISRLQAEVDRALDELTWTTKA